MLYVTNLVIGQEFDTYSGKVNVFQQKVLAF